MINSANTMQRQKQKYLRLLAEKYPTKEAVYADLINHVDLRNRYAKTVMIGGFFIPLKRCIRR